MNQGPPCNHSGKSRLTQPKPSVFKPRSTPACLLLLTLLCCVAACTHQDPQVVLNSDMIRAKFGSYGVAVLHSDPRQRISSLYSIEQQQALTRTFAIVDFNYPLPGALVAEHGSVTRGASIGEVFRSAGWQIEKHHVFIGELNIGVTHAEIGELMGIQLPQVLAAHVYLFVVKKPEQTLNYATITEIHHPDFLGIDELRQVYGEMLFDDSDRSSLDDFVTLPDGF